MQLFEATTFYPLLRLIAFFVLVYGRCPSKDNVLPTVSNGYLSNTKNVKLYSDGTAEGYYDVECEGGYALNIATGGRITCLSSGSWSQPLPQCKSMGKCSIPTLFTFLQTTSGIRVDQSLSFIYTNGMDDDQALGGSNITIRCANGYNNIGGSLTIICTEANSWTAFPNCVASPTSTITVTTVARCPVTNDTWTFPNGYMANTKDLTAYNDDTAIGSVIISCSVGYVLDSVSGGVYKCNSGTWSPRPYCTKTARCSLPILNNFVNDPTATKGLKISSQRLSENAEETDAVLIGSYILFNCKTGYKNTDNNLNVICNANGQWSPFPSCVPLKTTTVAGTSSSTPKSSTTSKAPPSSTVNVSGRKKY